MGFVLTDEDLLGDIFFWILGENGGVIYGAKLDGDGFLAKYFVLFGDFFM